MSGHIFIVHLPILGFPPRTLSEKTLTAAHGRDESRFHRSGGQKWTAGDCVICWASDSSIHHPNWGCSKTTPKKNWITLLHVALMINFKNHLWALVQRWWCFCFASMFSRLIVLLPITVQPSRCQKSTASGYCSNLRFAEAIVRSNLW